MSNEISILKSTLLQKEEKKKKIKLYTIYNAYVLSVILLQPVSLVTTTRPIGTMRTSKERRKKEEEEEEEENKIVTGQRGKRVGIGKKKREKRKRGKGSSGGNFSAVSQETHLARANLCSFFFFINRLNGREVNQILRRVLGGSRAFR